MSRKTKAELEQRVKELEREVEGLRKMFRLELANRQTFMDVQESLLEYEKNEKGLLRGSLGTAAVKLAEKNLQGVEGNKRKAAKQRARAEELYHSGRKQGMNRNEALDEVVKQLRKEFDKPWKLSTAKRYLKD